MKEQKRLKVITEVDAGRLTGRVAAELLGLSLRQTRRVIAAYRKEGAALACYVPGQAGLAHGNRGRLSARRIPEAIRKEILELVRSRYQDYNDTHFTEKLEELHDIKVSRSTVRRLRRSIGQGSPQGAEPAAPESPQGQGGQHGDDGRGQAQDHAPGCQHGGQGHERVKAAEEVDGDGRSSSPRRSNEEVQE